MPTEPIADLRRAAAAIAAQDDLFGPAVAAWLDGVAERMVAGGWVLPPERNHALKVARVILRSSAAGTSDNGGPPRLGRDGP